MKRLVGLLLGLVVLLVLQVLSIWPFVSMVASLFGFGAVVLLAWRTFRGRPAATPPVAAPVAAPVAG